MRNHSKSYLAPFIDFPTNVVLGGDLAVPLSKKSKATISTPDQQDVQKFVASQVFDIVPNYQ